MKSTNPLWRLFASVQLAIFIFFALASTSIIGTIIPQHRGFSFYSDTYGSFVAQFFFVLDIPNMYESWWFITLLSLLCLNLIICSIDRFPVTRRKVKASNLHFSTGKLESMACVYHCPKVNSKQSNVIPSLLSKNGWATKQATRNGETVFFSEKNAWSHYGVYIVHISILVIFLGATIGSIKGFKGSVMIPELGSADKIYAQRTSEPIDLGFTVRCDHFDIEFYDKGMPKDYKSKLTIIEGGNEILTKDIEVNKPLIYKGITFYQASYEGFQNFIITLKDKQSGVSNSLTADFQEQIDWPEHDLKVGILNAMSTEKRVDRVKVWLFDGTSDPVTFWAENNIESSVTLLDREYLVTVKQMYATGLQVTKDPGVWFVYFGCIALLLGLYIAFFISHRKIWLVLKSDKSILLAGTSNKNMIGFRKDFENIKLQITTAE